MDLCKKITAHLNIDDIKEIIAKYANGFTGFENVTKDNVKFEFGIREEGPQWDPSKKAYLKSCTIEVGKED